MCRERNIEIDEKTIPKIAFGFAGGIGNSGAVCGAVSGAVMAMSLERRKPDLLEESLTELDIVREFRRRFEAEMGCSSCRGLTGLDLSQKEGIEELMRSDIPQKVCYPAVGNAYQIAVDLLDELS